MKISEQLTWLDTVSNKNGKQMLQDHLDIAEGRRPPELQPAPAYLPSSPARRRSLSTYSANKPNFIKTSVPSGAGTRTPCIITSKPRAISAISSLQLAYHHCPMIWECCVPSNSAVAVILSGKQRMQQKSRMAQEF